MFGDLSGTSFADNWNVGCALNLIMMVLILLSLTTLGSLTRRKGDRDEQDVQAPWPNLLFVCAILVLIVQSFSARQPAKWQGFSLKWYIDLFNSASIMNAFYITVTIAVLAALFATILGTLASGIHKKSVRASYGL